MPNLTTYSINYTVPPPTSTAVLSMEVLLKKSVLVTPYTQVDQILSPVINQVYTYTTPQYNIHEIYDVYVQTSCDSLPVPSTQFGDRSYLVKTTPNVLIITPQIASFDIDWESWLDPVAATIPADTSLQEYIIEYKPSASAGPWVSVTLTDVQMATYWIANPGMFPNRTYTISAGILSGVSYDIKMTTVLKYNYITNTGTQVSNIVIPGPVYTETAL